MSAVFTWPVGRAADFDKPPNPPVGPPAAYAVGAALGGGLTGLLLGAAGVAVNAALPLNTVIALTAMLVVIAGASQWRGRLAPLPESKAQVPRHYLLWRKRWLTALAFGLIIGAGVLTRVKHAAVYVLAAVVLVVGSLGFGALLGAVYGLTRGLALVATWIANRFAARQLALSRPGPASKRSNRLLAFASAATWVVAAAAIL